jgi:hypothetical protein
VRLPHFGEKEAVGRRYFLSNLSSTPPRAFFSGARRAEANGEQTGYYRWHKTDSGTGLPVSIMEALKRWFPSKLPKIPPPIIKAKTEEPSDVVGMV